MSTSQENSKPTDDGEWSAVEHRALLDVVKPGEPSHQLDVYANMRGDCRKQLGHIKKRVEPGIACLAARGSAKFADMILVANTAVIRQAGYGLRFTSI